MGGYKSTKILKTTTREETIMNLTEPIRNKHKVNKLIKYYAKRGETRNCLLITLCVHTALRISDVLLLNHNDVYDDKQNVLPNITIREKKTGKTKIVALNKRVIAALKAHMPNSVPSAPLIINPRTQNAISRIQAYRLIQKAAKAIKVEQRVSCHSLRKTFGYHAWKDGVSPAIIMDIYNHSSFAVTKRYLGVTQDDKNNVYLRLSFAV